MVLAFALMMSAQGAVKPLAVIPFEFPKHEIVAKVFIDGHGPYSMLLDTGTAPSVIDLQLARKIGLKVAPTGEKGSGGGNDANPIFETKLPKFVLAGFSTDRVAALATDLSGLSRQFGQPIEGVLGDSYFAGRVVQFDYPNRIARIYSRSPFLGKDRKSITLPFKHDNSEVHLSGVFINGKPVAANLDTGSNSAFSLTPRAVKRLGLENAASETKHGASFNGGFKTRVGKLTSVQIGSIRVVSPSVTFWMPGTGHDDSPWDVNIGNPFLENYVVTVDYRDNVVTIAHHQ